MATYKITLSATGWTQTVAAIYWDTVSQALYEDANLTAEIGSLPKPTRECWQFDGFYASNSATEPGAQYINTDGSFTDAFYDKLMTLSGALTIYIGKTQVSWKLTLSDNGGTGGDGALYYRINGGGYFHSDLCNGEPVSSVARPRQSCYAFAGYNNGTTTPGTQYIDKGGNLTEALGSLSLTAAKMVYAKWVACYKITVSANSGTGGTETFYYDSVNGLFYATPDIEEPPISSITPHIRSTYKFLGAYATNATTGVQYVAPDGTILPAFVPTAKITIYAQWLLVSYKLTLGKNNGTGGTDALYCSNGAGAPVGWYLDDLCKTPATNIDPPARSGYAPKGLFTASSGGTLQINRDGSFTDEFAVSSITTAKTYYWHWVSVYKITLNGNNGTGGTGSFWYSSLDAAYFNNAELSQQISSITPPTRECYRFEGYFSAATSGTQYVTPSGQFTDALTSLAPTAAKTFYAHWACVSYKLTLDDNGGSGGSGALYCGGTNADYYADDQLMAKMTSVIVPTKRGHTTIGYFASKRGGSKYVNADGAIVAAVGITANVTVYARYSPNTYILHFSEGPTVQKQVTFGAAVGALPVPTKGHDVFIGWIAGNEKIEATTVWNFDSDVTVRAMWLPRISENFGNAIDYFGLTSSSLVPISSNSGDNKQHICVAHVGKFEENVEACSGVWRNPTVTYAVLRSFTFKATLGKAFAATQSGVSGYMITEIEVATSVGSFPTITVSATANEGSDAINLFPVSVPIVARSRAQNLIGAISGGGHLNACNLVACCDPVVVAENMMPCASDVVNGKITVTASTVAANGETAPTVQNGFASLGEPKQMEGQQYAMWQIVAERGL